MTALRALRALQALFSFAYLALVILTVPLAFDVGGIPCGLSYSFTLFSIYFVLTTVRMIAKRSRWFRWVSLLYYTQHFVIPSLLTFFLSYYSSKQPSPRFNPVDVWKFCVVNSTPIITIMEGFCSLLLIQAVGQTLNWFTIHRSDNWLIVSLVGSGLTTTTACYFLYRIYTLNFTIDMVNASLLGSSLTLTIGIGAFGIVSGRGSMIESSLLLAYIVRCIYETFPDLSENASEALASLFAQTTTTIKNQIPLLPPPIIDTVLNAVPFLASNLPMTLKTIWHFLVISLQKLTVPLLLSLAYRLSVFYAATKIIPSLYYGSMYPTFSPPRTPASKSRKSSSSSLFQEGTIPKPQSLPHKNISTRQPKATILKLIYAYSPCFIIFAYTHLMMQYSGQLGTELKLWGFWESSDFTVIVHPWQFWNWINMATTLLLYTAELLGNTSPSGGNALTSHWKVD
jgi:hypothetical protein